MHRRWLNHARLGIVLVPRGPWLIKSGQETPDPTLPRMVFVRTRHARAGETVYLPGTSLKGTLRSHAERSLRGLDVEVCDPLAAACPPPGDEKVGSAEVFKSQCPACQTFGSLNVGGRCNIFDAYPWPPDAEDQELQEAVRRANRTEVRHQVAIDRQTGGARTSALFDLEVVVDGEFYTEILLENFQLWQLGLIAAVLQDVDSGDVPIGFGKSRGLGQVGVRFRELRIEALGKELGTIRGAASLEPAAESYGLFHTKDTLDVPEDLATSDVDRETTWRGSRLRFRNHAVEQVLSRAVDQSLAAFVEARSQPEGTP